MPLWIYLIDFNFYYFCLVSKGSGKEMIYFFYYLLASMSLYKNININIFKISFNLHVY